MEHIDNSFILMSIIDQVIYAAFPVAAGFDVERVAIVTIFFGPDAIFIYILVIGQKLTSYLAGISNHLLFGHLLSEFEEATNYLLGVGDFKVPSAFHLL